MSKYGIGVGEDFPVDEPPPPSNTPPENRDPHREHWRRFGALHVALHVLTRLAIIGLIVAAAVALFRPYGGRYPAAGYYSYTHHFFFFPFWPFVLILILAFAWRRHGYYGHRRHWHWHDGPHHDHREGA